MSIRRCRPSDAPAVAALATELGYPTGEAQARARLPGLLARDEDVVLVAEDERGAVVGWLHARETRCVESDPCAEIAGLVVAAACRRRGHGRALVEGALRWAAGRGLPTVRVRTNVVREETQSWYRAAGFAAVKTQVVFARSSATPEGPEDPEDVGQGSLEDVGQGSLEDGGQRPRGGRPRRRARRLLLALLLSAALLGWVVREIFELAAAPREPKACDYVFPRAAGGEAAALPLPPAPDGLPFLQRGGTVRDASCLDRTAVAGVVGVRRAADVAAALRWARAAGLKVTAAGERHSMGGQSFVRQGLVLDMHGMHRMSLDRAARLLTVESGARWFEVQRFLDRQGLAVKAMQSINIFTVGGALSVNAHGIAHDPGPVAATVRSLRIMTADGEVRTASRSENPDLFRAALGGYGLVGVILEAQLEVVPNVLYRPRTQYVDYKGFPAFYRAHVAGAPTVGLFYARVSVSPLRYLREVAVHTYSEVPGAGDAGHLVDESDAALPRFVINFSKTGGLGRLLRWGLEKHLAPRLEVCSRNQAMAGSEVCLVSRNQEMYDSMQYLQNRLPDTDILQEYFVPPDAAPAFLDGLRAAVRRHDANLLNVTIRRVEKDSTTALPYARGERFAFVLYFNQRLNDRASRVLDATTRDLVDLALGLGGTFYLPYRLCYTGEQLRRAYPGFDDLARLKWRYDPDELFTNEMFERYKPHRPATHGAA